MKRLIRLVFLLLCLIAAAVAFLLMTEQGLRWGAQVAQSVVPRLSVGQTEGSLIEGFVLKNLAYRNDSADVAVEELEFRWQPAELCDFRLHVDLLRAEGIQVTTKKTEEPEKPPAWPDIKLPLAIRLDELRVRDVAIRTVPDAAPIEIRRLDGKLALDENGLQIESLEGISPLGELRLSGSAGLSGEPVLDVKTDWQVRLEGRPEFQGSGSISGGAEKLTARQHLQAPIEADVVADVADPLGTPQWTANLKMPRFDPRRLDPKAQSWPLSADLFLRGESAGIRAEGRIGAQLPAVGDAEARLAGSYRWSGAAAIDVLSLSLPATGTQFDLHGNVQGIPDALRVDAEAQWRNLAWPPGPKPEWQSPEGSLRVSGEQRDLRVDLRGKLREYLIEAGGNLGLKGEVLAFRDVHVDGAGAQIKLNGTLGPRLDFHWQADVANLGLWLPGGRGELHSRGTLAGSRDNPALDGELSVRGAAFDEVAAERLHLSLGAGIQPDSPIRFQLSADNLQADGRRFDAELSGQGTRAQHRLEGRIATEPYRLSLEASGGLEDNKRWAGTLRRFDLAEPILGGLELLRPAGLELGPAGGALKSACWSVAEGRLCLDGQVNEQRRWRLAADVDEFSLEALRKQIPAEARVTGFADLRARLEGDNARLLSGDLALDFRQAAIEVKAGDQTLRFVPEEPRLRAMASGRHIELNFQAEQAGVAGLRGRVALTGPLDFAALPQASMDGEVRVELPNLALAEPWVPEVHGIAGRLEANASLAGTPVKPAVNLDAALRNGGFSLPRLGLQVKSLQLAARSAAPNAVTFEGRALSGGGDVQLSGRADFGGADGPSLDAKIQGQRFLAADIPEAKVRISPDLSLAYRANKLTASGKVLVPEAKITVAEQNKAIKPSSDVVIVGETPKESADAVKIAAQVDVILGSKVNVEAMGFKGRLDGHVLIDQSSSSGMPLGTGQIDVREGTYSYFGVALTIQEGRAMFAHSPVDNPALYVEVRRQESNVSAGLKVLGTASKPEIVLYSDPPMAQADILSYVLTGKSFNFASDQQGSVLKQAASSLSGPAANLVAKEISSRLGLGNWIDDIGVQTRPGSQNPALYLGKYLTPRLYVQYGLSFFQNTNVFRMRYDLTKHWKLQSETGDHSGGDILFEWEQ